jgi:hypothetical protein
LEKGGNDHAGLQGTPEVAAKGWPAIDVVMQLI